MNARRHIARHGPKQFASALMLWFAVLLSVAAGLQPVAPFDLSQSRSASSGAARTSDLPIQRSTASTVQARAVLASERAVEPVSAQGFDGPDAALPPQRGLDLPADRSARGETRLPVFAVAIRPAGFRARAPPVLA